MAYTTINKSSDYFNTKLYTGNGSTQSITGVGFTQDFTWIKIRSEVNHNRLMDTVRGATKELYSDLTSAEVTGANGLTSFDSDGFSLGTDNAFNKSSATYASWNWKANGTGSANTDGTINSTVSANTTAGFSIVSFTGNGSANQTVGHGLSQKPDIIFYKDRTGANAWRVIPTFINDGHYLALNTSGAIVSSSTSYFGTTTSSVLGISGSNSGITNTSGNSLIAYCFAEKTGYSKFGSYKGNGNADGTFVYTGFKPAFVIHKRTDTGASWMMYDNKRQTINPKDQTLFADLNNAESGGDAVDFLSNGFKQRSTGASQNASGGSYIYMAFASAPLVGTNNVPCTAI